MEKNVMSIFSELLNVSVGPAANDCLAYLVRDDEPESERKWAKHPAEGERLRVQDVIEKRNVDEQDCEECLEEKRKRDAVVVDAFLEHWGAPRALDEQVAPLDFHEPEEVAAPREVLEPRALLVRPLLPVRVHEIVHVLGLEIERREEDGLEVEAVVPHYDEVGHHRADALNEASERVAPE